MDIKEKAATIYDIAKMTGLAASTVSRALNNKGYISEDTRKEIDRAVKSLNYYPNPAARSLKTNRSKQIILALKYSRDYFNFDMIDAVQDVAKENDYALLLNFTGDSEDEEIRMLKSIRQNFADGLIMLSINFTEKHIKEIKNINYPFVLSGISKNNSKWECAYDYVGVDTEKGSFIATKHLINQGHRRIGYVGLPTLSQSWDERHNGFCTAMKEAGLAVQDSYVFTGDYKEQFGYEAGKKYSLRKHDMPTAICASTDIIALGLYRAFEEDGIRIPEDISIIGMDNTDMASRIKPKLSSVSLSQAGIGRAAATLIFNRLNGSKEPFKDIIFQPELILRESSCSIAGANSSL